MKKDFWKILGYCLFYVLLCVLCLFSFFIVAGVLTRYSYRKSQKNFIKKVEYKKAKLTDQRINLVESLNKLEKKLSKNPDSNKYLAKQSKIKKQIENLALVLDTTSKQAEELANKEIKETKLETKLNEIKDNLV